MGGQALSEALARSFPDRRIIVVHAALDGYKQPQQLFALAYLLALGGEFDLVLNIDGFNEVSLPGTKNVDRGVAAAFPRDWSLIIADLHDVPSTLLAGEVLFLRDQRGRWASLFTGTPLRFSSFAQLGWMVRDRWFERRVEQTLTRLDASILAAEPDGIMGPPAPSGDNDVQIGEMADLWSRCSLMMDQLCQAQGMTYLHFLQPNQYVAGTNVVGPRSGSDQVYGDHPLRADAETGYPLLIGAGQLLRLGGVRFHDLTGIFVGTTEVVYSDSCCHLNDRGNLILAQRILEAVLLEME